MVCAAALLATLSGCGKSGDGPPVLSVANSASEKPATTTEPEKAKYNPFPEVEVKTSAGTFTLKLDAHKAPLTVNNFLFYVNRGLYNGTVFHAVYRDFIVLGGGFDAKMQQRPTEMPIRNEAHNGLKNKRGTIAIARPPDGIDSATNQFFINLADNPSLDYAGPEAADYGYCVFGEVTTGLDVIDRIGEAEVHSTDQFENLPIEPIVIESIRQISQKK
jgi:cyclophilin family peptidyl-prolyl cis-trans isomerase